MFRHHCLLALFVSILLAGCLLLSTPLPAQECAQAGEIDPALRTAIDQAATRYIQLAAHGDVQSLRSEAIPLLAANFGGVQLAINHDRGAMGDQVTIRREYLLDASHASARLPRAEFFCGAFSGNGHTASSASFVIPELDPGQYALVLTNVAGGTLPYMTTVVLQKVQGQWRLAGYYAKPTEVNGHDAAWYVRQARLLAEKGEAHNAWLYYTLAWETYAPVEFMSSLQLDKLSAEIQAARPADVPTGSPVTLTAANGRSYNLTQLYAVADLQGGLTLVARYEASDVSDTARAFQENTAVIKAVAARYPELRQLFSGIVARATTPDGADYGTLLAMKDIH